MLIIAPEDGAIIHVNQAAVDFYGWSGEQFLALHIDDLNTLPVEEIREEMANALTIKRDHFNFRHRLADGSIRDVEVYSGPVQFDGREQLYSIVHDVTEQRRITEEMANVARRSEAMLALPAALEGLDETAFLQRGQALAEELTDSDISFFHFVHEDEAAIEFVAWSRRLPDEPRESLYESHYPISDAGAWADALRKRRPVIFNDCVKAPDRRGLPDGYAELKRLISVPVMERGSVVMLVGVGNKPTEYTDRDVETVQLIANEIWRIVQRQRSEQSTREALEAQRALNRQLKDAQAQLLQSEKMASIGQLAAGVAHELNNPIGFVKSNLGSLENYLQDLFTIVDACTGMENGGDEHFAALEKIRALKQEKDYDFLRSDVFALLAESRDGLVRVAKIVQDLKDFSRAGDAEWQEADLHQGLESTLNIVWNELKYKCTVNKEYGDIPPISCIPAQLNQVFMNLLVNASQSIVEHGEITLRTGRRDGEVFVVIADTGAGIPQENLRRIFEPFFTTKPVGKGTGLGLSLAYGIVSRHHGRIEVDSVVGKGTTFTIWLPIAQ